MIEALKSDRIADKIGGRFKLCTLIQRRLVQLMEGGRPLVERHGRSDLELVIDEILQDKITLEFVPTEPALPRPRPAGEQPRHDVTCGARAKSAGRLRRLSRREQCPGPGRASRAVSRRTRRRRW